jgi:hypothetical protein
MKLPLKLILSTLLTLGTPLTATAQYENGNLLLRDLQDVSKSGFGPIYALGYIVGAADAYGGSALCIPQSVTKGQLNDVVQKFLEQEPGIRDMGADVLVLIALSKYWACPKGERKEKKRS